MSQEPVTALHPLIREKKLSAARELIRAAQIESPEELLQMLQNIHASISRYTFAHHANSLIDLCTDIDGALHEGEPEMLGVDKRGEYDAFTVRSV